MGWIRKYPRIRIILLVLILVTISLLAGCSKTEPDVSFSYEYEVESTTYRPGDTVSILVVVTNLGDGIECNGRDLDMFQEASLTTSTRDYAYSIYWRREMTSGDVTNAVFTNGATTWHTYTFEIPDDAILGSYDLNFGFFSENDVRFEDVIEVIE